MKLVLIMLAALVGDQLLKQYIVSSLAVGEGMAFIPGLLRLTRVHNTGMSFSLLNDHQWILLAVIPVVLGVMIFLLAKGLVRDKFQRYSLALVIGGAASNLLDRIVRGYVVDMFQTEFMQFAVFNLADCFIICGGVLFCIFFLLEERRNGRNGEKVSGHGD